MWVGFRGLGPRDLRVEGFRVCRDAGFRVQGSMISGLGLLDFGFRDSGSRVQGLYQIW